MYFIVYLSYYRNTNGTHEFLLSVLIFNSSNTRQDIFVFSPDTNGLR